VDAEIAVGIQVPIPKDFSEVTRMSVIRRIFLIAQKAGVLYQILGDKKYAILR
jgi:hypothetical protein